MASLDEDGSDKKLRDILDLSQISINSKSELKKLLERVPDFRVRPEKVRDEETSIEDENCVENFAYHDYQFANPIPSSLRDVCLKELGRVNISWRMLTISRPKSKLEEDFFTRIVQLEKLQYKTFIWEMEKEALKNKKAVDAFRGKTAGRSAFRSGFNVKSSVSETRLHTCKECGIEFCYGTCKTFLYDDCARTFNPVTVDIFEIHRKVGNKSKKGAVGLSGGNKLSQEIENHAGIASPDGGEKLDEVKASSSKQSPPIKNAGKSKVLSKIKLRKNKKSK